MSLLRVVAALLFVLAALAAFGWLLNQSVGNALGLVAFGLAAWVVATLPSPPLGPPT